MKRGALPGNHSSRGIRRCSVRNPLPQIEQVTCKKQTKQPNEGFLRAGTVSSSIWWDLTRPLAWKQSLGTPSFRRAGRSILYSVSCYIKVPTPSPLCLLLLGQIFTYANPEAFHYLCTLEGSKWISSSTSLKFFERNLELWNPSPPPIFPGSRPPLSHLPPGAARQGRG